MNMNEVVYRNHRKEIDAMMQTINAVLNSPVRDQHLNKAGEGKFFSFNFVKFPSQRFVLPYLKAEILKREDIKEVKWEFSDKFNTIYFYVYLK